MPTRKHRKIWQELELRTNTELTRHIHVLIRTQREWSSSRHRSSVAQDARRWTRLTEPNAWFYFSCPGSSGLIEASWNLKARQIAGRERILNGVTTIRIGGSGSVGMPNKGEELVMHQPGDISVIAEGLRWN
jgi:hypothetical protein